MSDVSAPVPSPPTDDKASPPPSSLPAKKTARRRSSHPTPRDRRQTAGQQYDGTKSKQAKRVAAATGKQEDGILDIFDELLKFLDEEFWLIFFAIIYAFSIIFFSLAVLNVRHTHTHTHTRTPSSAQPPSQYCSTVTNCNELCLLMKTKTNTYFVLSLCVYPHLSPHHHLNPTSGRAMLRTVVYDSMILLNLACPPPSLSPPFTPHHLPELTNERTHAKNGRRKTDETANHQTTEIHGIETLHVELDHRFVHPLVRVHHHVSD